MGSVQVLILVTGNPWLEHLLSHALPLVLFEKDLLYVSLFALHESKGGHRAAIMKVGTLGLESDLCLCV